MDARRAGAVLSRRGESAGNHRPLGRLLAELKDETEPGPESEQGEAPSTQVLRGSVAIAKLEELFGVELPRERAGDSTTISGMLNHLAGNAPRPGEVTEYDSLRFEMLEANQREVLRLRARRLRADSAASAPPA